MVMSILLTDKEKEDSFRQAMFNVIKNKIAEEVRIAEAEKNLRDKQQRRSGRQQMSMESKEKLKNAKEHLNRGLTAMDSCHTIFFELFHYSEHLAKALQFELEEAILEIIRDNTEKIFGADSTITKLSNQIINPPKISGLAKMIIESSLTKLKQIGEDPDLFLPGILHFVELTKDSKISETPLRFSSGLGRSEEANKLFNDEFRAWLSLKGFEEDRTTKQVVDKNTGAVLTPDAFEKLRDDPTNGLTAHLKKQWEKVDNIVQERPPASGSSPAPNP